ncbi:hypothetical protein, partial [Chitinophaga sp.]|uniref:hypothetical protein n=1 Tax=Chitinophaga sp. TaxID=1869181 RepID=UPI002FDE836E
MPSSQRTPPFPEAPPHDGPSLPSAQTPAATAQNLPAATPRISINGAPDALGVDEVALVTGGSLG